MQRRFSSFILIYFILVCSLQIGCHQTSADRANSPAVEEKNQNTNYSYIKNSENPLYNHGNSEEKLIWTGNYQDIEYQWTTKDFYIKFGSGKEEKLLSYYVKKTFEDRVEKADKSRSCERFFSINILSVVGTIISIEDDASSTCYYADSQSKLITLDINKPGEFYDSSRGEIDLSKSSRVAKLTDYFTKQEIFQALIELPEIQRTLQYAEKYKKPQNLQELLMAIDTVGVDGINGTAHKLTDLSWSSFAFIALRDEKVVVDVELKPSASSTSHPRLTLQLPTPTKLKQELEFAASQKSGFLGKDIESISNWQKTKISVTFAK